MIPMTKPISQEEKERKKEVRPIGRPRKELPEMKKQKIEDEEVPDYINEEEDEYDEEEEKEDAREYDEGLPSPIAKSKREITKEEYILVYEQELLKLKDFELQIASGKRTIKDEGRIDGLIQENDLLILLVEQQFKVKQLKIKLMEEDIDERTLQDIEKRVEGQSKEYELFLVKRGKF